MKPGSYVRRAANLLLRPMNLELSRATKRKKAVTMDAALLRSRDLGLEVQTIIDIGASNGKWARRAMGRFPEASALAMEPLEEQREALEALKSKLPKFDYVLAVAGGQEGEVGLNVSGDLDGSSVADGASENLRMVPMTTVDHEVAQRGLQGPYLIKLDTHGFEVPILAGAVDTLKRANVVIIEAYNFKLTDQCLRFHEMCSYMETLGFRCFDMADPMLRERDRVLWQMDLFFAPSDHGIFKYERYV